MPQSVCLPKLSFICFTSSHSQSEVAVPKEVVTEPRKKMMVPEVAVPMEEVTELVTRNEVYVTIEDCTLEELVHPGVPATGSGDGDGDGVPDELISTMADEKSGSNACASLITEIVPLANHEVISDPSSILGPPPEIILLAPEASAWDDLPEPEPIQEPIVTPQFFLKRSRPAPENVEVDDVVQTMRSILMDLRNEDDARLSPEDEAKVRSVLEYHPKAEEKMGSGIDYIKIKRHGTFKDVRCFWVVRTDGSETDISYHKCLKEKVAKEHASFVDRYDAIYRTPKRPRGA